MTSFDRNILVTLSEEPEGMDMETIEEHLHDAVRDLVKRKLVDWDPEGRLTLTTLGGSAAYDAAFCGVRNRFRRKGETEEMVTIGPPGDALRVPARWFDD